MDNLRRVCVIHDKKDKVPAMYLYEFMNWMGFAYFDYTYNEMNDELNNAFINGDNQFDLIFHINDDSGNWKYRFGKYGRINIDVDWKQEQSTDEDFGKVRRYRLLRLWFSVCKELNLKINSQVRKALGRSILLFSRYNLGLMLFNTGMNQNDIKLPVPQEYEEGYKCQADIWKTVAESLIIITKCKDSKTEAYMGKEYFLYAYVNSCRRRNEIDVLLQRKKYFDTFDLLMETDRIYSYDSNFCSLERLKAKISDLDEQYDSMSFSFNQESTKRCTNDLCNSFNYYRRGKKYELSGQKERALSQYVLSYKKNSLNFRAIYKLAIDELLREHWECAKKYLEDIFQILQVDIYNKEKSKESLLYLNPIELEYVCKCYRLLGNIQVDGYLNYIRAADYFERSEKVCMAIKDNYFIQVMCMDLKNNNDKNKGGELGNLLENLFLKKTENRLSSESISEKVMQCKKTKMYKEWEAQHGGISE